ncbi:MAG: hypothetical protein IAA97_02330 [Spirochaetes bacterium]|uniref:Uncharacterized protein n=1 Tax=Candidatus Ornithospirochaeta stercoripullorum TaxID=2840899 RepID=A0A9D9H5D1_9SPIO|nr:hypothetical protein [Candidatus Ornithospirochaeta stercoripullorum]
MKKKRERIHKLTLKEQIKTAPGLFAVYILLRTSVVLVMIAQIFNKDWQNVMLCIYSLFLFTIPSFIERNWHIDIPDTLEIIILVFIYAAEILGEIRAFYVKVPGWDTALHTITGFLSAAVGFSLVDIINRNENTKLYLSPLYVAIGAFCFSMTIGVLWEFFEFSADMLFGLDMQKDTVVHELHTVLLDESMMNKVVSITGITETAVNGQALGVGGYIDIGLIDTMKDLFVNLLGAFVFSIIGFFYIKGRGNGKIAKRFMPTLKGRSASENGEIR